MFLFLKKPIFYTAHINASQQIISIRKCRLSLYSRFDKITGLKEKNNKKPKQFLAVLTCQTDFLKSQFKIIKQEFLT